MLLLLFALPALAAAHPPSDGAAATRRDESRTRAARSARTLALAALSPAERRRASSVTPRPRRRLASVDKERSRRGRRVLRRPPSAASLEQADRRSRVRPRERRIKRHTISLLNIHTRETVEDLPLFVESKKRPGLLLMRRDARRKLAWLVRDHRNHKVHHRMPDSLWFFLYLVAYHYDRPLHIVSGYRSKERHTSRHYMGKAIDFTVPGVHPKEVWEYCKRRFTHRGVGLGYYPHSGFIHLDIREESFYWIDDSRAGERARYRQGIAQPVDQWKEVERRKRRRERRRKDR